MLAGLAMPPGRHGVNHSTGNEIESLETVSNGYLVQSMVFMAALKFMLYLGKMVK
jgi:hypothetical protein